MSVKRFKYVGSMSSVVLYDGREVKRGEAFEVENDAIAASLLKQEDNYAAIDAEKPASHSRPHGGRN
jgi:hypothetical protein